MITYVFLDIEIQLGKTGKVFIIFSREKLKSKEERKLKATNSYTEFFYRCYFHPWFVFSKVIYVPTDYPTIQEAINAYGDEIRIATGVYSYITTTQGLTQVAYIGKNMVLHGGYNPDFSEWNPQLYPTTLDAKNQ